MKVLILEDTLSADEHISSLLKDFNQEIKVQQVDSITDSFNWLIANKIQQATKPNFKNRFLVKTGNNLLFKNTEEIAYFFAQDKIVYLVANDAKQYIVDYRLEQLETLLNPHVFYRVNRKFFINIDAIQKIKLLSNIRLQLFLKPNFDQEIFISKDKIKDFKAWLDQ